MQNLKTPLICAGIGFVLSLFLGLVNRVQFFNILVRAGITGIIFGGFVFVTAFILQKFIPELFTLEAVEEHDLSGVNVNITLDDIPNEGDASVQSSSFMVENDILSNASDSGQVSLNDTGSIFASDESSRLQDDSENFSDLISSNISEIENFSDNDIPLTSSDFSVAGNETVGGNTKVMAQAIRTILKADE